MSARMAMCACGEPLIATFLNRGKEFLCICCGRTYEFFGPEGAEVTPERDARHEELNDEFQTHAGAFLIPGSWRSDCAQCGPDSPHISHASDEEVAADAAARAWLKQRIEA